MFRSRVWTGTLVLLLAVALGVSACAEPVGYAPSANVGYGYPWVDGLGWWGGWGHWDHHGWDHQAWGHGFVHGHPGFAGHSGFGGGHSFSGGGHSFGGGHGR